MTVERIGDATLYLGDVRECLREMADESVHCAVTSPPYWGLRNYGIEPSVWGGEPGCEHEWEIGMRKGQTGGSGESSSIQKNRIEPMFGSIQYAFCRRCAAWLGCLGLEPTPELYVQHLVEVFRGLRPKLRRDGTCWVNIGDAYASDTKWGGRSGGKNETSAAGGYSRARKHTGLKPKDLCMIPARVALALQADGWWLRSDVVWNKPGPMPESCEDRPTKAHEYVFLLSKRARYFYDAEAIKEKIAEATKNDRVDTGRFHPERGFPGATDHGNGRLGSNPGGLRNRRTVWTISTQPFDMEMCTACNRIYWRVEYKRLDVHIEIVNGKEKEHRICTCGRRDAWLSHFATFPEALVEPRVLAGCPAQTCPECGAPWVRVVEISRKDTRPARTSKYGTLATDIRSTGEGNIAFGLARRTEATVTTLGFRPSCSCGRSDTVPGVMLDPFAGAGTALKVALRLGRRAVGCEIKPEYMAMTKKRIREEAAQGKLELQA